MEPSDLLEWVLVIGLVLFVVFSITGWDELLSKQLSQSPTKSDLQSKIDALEERIHQLEANQKISDKVYANTYSRVLLN